ncbi:MAG: MFS transporter [Alphaproteobacteria bacterium]|nr:MFS transporter [Alphaproteobacteria bacterium]MBV9586112.1 MFS transporter [Alphaproteobacteria bacterium]
MDAATTRHPSLFPPSHVLGRKLDSIPFSAYHVILIVVLGFVGFIEGYDLALTGSLLVLAKGPLHLTPEEVRSLAVWPTFVVVLGGFSAAAMSDRVSRVAVMQIGVILSTGCTLLILVAQNFEELFILRLITGIGLGFTISAPFPIAAELMPAQHRRTYAAIYEVMLASAFTLLPFVGYVLADHPNGFRLVGLPGGVTLFVAPVLIYLLIPESPRWLLRRGRPEAAVDAVNLIIRRCGSRVPLMTVAELAGAGERPSEQLPPFWKLFAPGQLRWTTVGILCSICGGTAYYLIAILLPKALVDQGAAVSLSFGLSTLVFAASIPGKLFNGFIMEVIGRRWTITGAFIVAIPGLILMMTAHSMGSAATVVFIIGTLITGFSVLSCFPAVRVYLSEQFPTALRGRGHFFGESFGRIFAGVLAPFLLEPRTGSPSIFFGTMIVVVAIGACIPLVFGRETLGNLETFTEAVPELA